MVFFNPEMHNRSEVEKAVAEVESFSKLPEDNVTMLSKEVRLEVAYTQVSNAVVVRSLSNSGIKNLLTKIFEELEGLGKLGPTSTPR